MNRSNPNNIFRRGAMAGFAFLLIALLYAPLHAQVATLCSGGDVEHPDGSLSYSVGQSLYEVTSGADGSVWEGVQQPYEISRSVGLFEDAGMELFPNPTPGNATLYMIDFFVDDLFFAFFDFQGRLIYSDEITNMETIIPMERLSSGAYLLTIFYQQRKIRSFKVIKY